MSNVRSAPKADLLYPAQHGLEAQREAISRFAQAEGFFLGRIFTEVETGKGALTAYLALRKCEDLRQRRNALRNANQKKAIMAKRKKQVKSTKEKGSDSAP